MSILVFDVGSSGLKAALFSREGDLIGLEGATYENQAPHRQDPEDWWRAAVSATRALGPPGVKAIVLSGTMENLIAVDAQGTPVFPAVLYSDGCGAAYLERAAASLEAIGAAAIMGNAPEPLMTGFKALWLKEAHPEAFAAAHYLLPGAKDLIGLRLTGTAATDPTTASTTGLMDFSQRTWSRPILDALGLDETKLPPILASDAITGHLEPDAAAALGLPSGIPVITGAGDGGATTVGSGATAAGDTSLYLGTTGWVAKVIAGADTDPAKPFYRLSHPLSPDTIAITPILSAGAASRWAQKALNLDEQSADRLAMAADIDPGDALFLPYLSGERFPFLDLDLRAGFVGIDTDTDPGALYHAVLEGVALAIASNLDAMGRGEGTVSLVGGGALSPLWPQLIADIADVPVHVPGEPVSATARGAFLIACQALSRESSAHHYRDVFTPRRERHARTERLRTAFARATEAFRALARD